MGGKDDRLARVRSTKPPPWPTVIKTTFRLWLARRTAARLLGETRRWPLVLLSVVVIGGLAAALAAVLVDQPGPAAVAAPGKPSVTHPSSSPSSTSDPAPTEPSIQASAQVRGQAADWVAQQVSPDAIVSCDPAMCSVLQAHGVPSSQLLVLLLADADPLGSDVVVATSAVRSQFGTSLITVYAPEVLASFGSGATRIDIRAIAPDGAKAFEAGVAADSAARIGAGKQLLRNPRIAASPAARTALAAGSVDPRLLATLAALAVQQHVSLLAFGDPSPGAPQVPLRSAELGGATPAQLRSMESFLRAQRTPFLPDQLSISTAAGGQHVLNIEYDAPGPLGLGGE
ncbi:MAG TPA: hypothetical protein VN969_40580 [Streptosporangiaceae bacterium]|nr:hypothetical protein [Streptosporangiaceae bacterium]